MQTSLFFLKKKKLAIFLIDAEKQRNNTEKQKENILAEKQCKNL